MACDRATLSRAVASSHPWATSNRRNSSAFGSTPAKNPCATRTSDIMHVASRYRT